MSANNHSSTNNKKLAKASKSDTINSTSNGMNTSLNCNGMADTEDTEDINGLTSIPPPMNVIKAENSTEQVRKFNVFFLN
jgi:hypothetical protein